MDGVDHFCASCDNLVNFLYVFLMSSDSIGEKLGLSAVEERTDIPTEYSGTPRKGHSWIKTSTG